MRKVLLIIGILVLVACAFSLAAAILNGYGYHNVVDGSASLYARLHRRMIIYSVSTAFLAVAGTVCIIIQSKI